MIQSPARWSVALLLAAGAACAVLPPMGSVKFSRRMLVLDPNEGCAVADVDRDGRPDVIAGRHWYAAPGFVPRPLRLLEEWDSYLRSNGEFAWDVNGDGWVDVISGSWMQGEVFWYENPGARELARGRLWKPHLLKDTGTVNNEVAFLRDLDGDGVPEWIVNSWIKDAPFLAWKLARDASGQPTLEKIVLGTKGSGHGMGFGDLNGDGREDILVGRGWYERPAGAVFARPWEFHQDWDLHASCPMIVADVNGDGRNDFFWGKAHDYGLYWMEQEARPDGKRGWEPHLIDKSWSQPHVLEWTDLDGDGRPELIAGKRVRAHDKGDPGNDDPPCLYYYAVERGRRPSFARHAIDLGGAGVGMQVRVADLDGDGRPDLVTPGKSGTYIFFNAGRRQAPRR